MKTFTQFITEKFQITNDVQHLSKEEMETLTMAAHKTEQKLKRAGFGNVAKGNITIGYPDKYMPEQRHHKVAYGAVYIERDDKVVVFQHYLRDVNSLTSLLLHEFGHKHWHKFVKSNKQRLWIDKYSSEREAREEYADAFRDRVEGANKGSNRDVAFEALLKG